MAIDIKEALPALRTILEQQEAISERLRTLNEIFTTEYKPVEPVLRSMLKPIREKINQMDSTISKSSRS